MRCPYCRGQFAWGLHEQCSQRWHLRAVRKKTHPLLDVDHLKDVVSSKLKDSKELGDLISRQIRDYVDELGLSSDQKASVTDWLQERDGVVRHNILQQLMDQD